MEKARSMQRDNQGPVSKYYQPPDDFNIGGTGLGVPGVASRSQIAVSEPRRSGALQNNGLRLTGNSGGPKQAPPRPGRIRGNQKQYKNFVGNLGADMSDFNVNGL